MLPCLEEGAAACEGTGGSGDQVAFNWEQPGRQPGGPEKIPEARHGRMVQRQQADLAGAALRSWIEAASGLRQDPRGSLQGRGYNHKVGSTFEEEEHGRF